jgi:hypothetical protein
MGIRLVRQRLRPVPSMGNIGHCPLTVRVPGDAGSGWAGPDPEGAADPAGGGRGVERTAGACCRRPKNPDGAATARAAAAAPGAGPAARRCRSPAGGTGNGGHDAASRRPLIGLHRPAAWPAVDPAPRRCSKPEVKYPCHQRACEVRVTRRWRGSRPKLGRDGTKVGFVAQSMFPDGPVALGWLRASHRSVRRRARPKLRSIARFPRRPRGARRIEHRRYRPAEGR